MQALKLLTREHGSSLEIREAVVRPSTFNADARTVEVVAATGTPVPRGDYDEVLAIREDAVDVRSIVGAPVLNGHRLRGVENVIGTVIAARIENDSIICTLQLSDRPEVAGIVRDIETGILNQVSAGFAVGRWQEGTANGRRTRTATQWGMKEVSFVPIGADPLARTRSLAPSDRSTINPRIRELVRGMNLPPHLADTLIDRGASVQDARNLIFDDLVTRGRLPLRTAIGIDHTDPAMQTRAVGDALYAKMTGTAPSGQARELVHRSVIDLMAHHARVVGIPLRSENPADIFETVMHTRAAVGLHSTSDFPIVLANTMGRRLGELFKAAESGASAIVATGSARDFRPITEARMTSFPSLAPLNENGEIVWGSLDEEGEVLAIASYARAIGITFKVIVNDDLSAVDRSIRDTAFATAQLKARLIVAALAAVMSDAAPLFDVRHGNLAESGVVGPPDEASLSAGRVAMMKQTPPGSTEPLGLSPSILLVPAELQTIGEKLVTSINPTVTDNVNVFAGKLQVAVEPRLPNDAQWFLFAAPGTYPVIRFLTLAGFEGPRFETNQEFTRLGTSFRVHWHCGAGPIDHRGAWKNPGA